MRVQYTGSGEGAFGSSEITKIVVMNNTAVIETATSASQCTQSWLDLTALSSAQ